MLTGPVTEVLVCQLGGSGLNCSWPTTDPVVAGGYYLQVTAPGYETAIVVVKVSIDVGGYCGCSMDEIAPAAVSLLPTCPSTGYTNVCPQDGGKDGAPLDAAIDAATDARD